MSFTKFNCTRQQSLHHTMASSDDEIQLMDLPPDAVTVWWNNCYGVQLYFVKLMVSFLLQKLFLLIMFERISLIQHYYNL